MLNFVKSWSPTSNVAPAQTITLRPRSAAATGYLGSLTLIWCLSLNLSQ